MKPLGVTQLNNQIKALLESHFVTLMVEGEISNFTHHSSGHMYFSLKDENSSIKCVMFKGNGSRLKFAPQNGMKILASCGLSVYSPRGEYQLICEGLEPAGAGSLKVAFEQLKQKLQDKGYFDQSKKKPIPRYPKKIALITSATGAALQDMKRVAQNRWKLTSFTLFNTLVQGSEAKEQIVENLKLADRLEFDIIVLSRGGGSIEDLWPFNEEVVADAIFNSHTPIVSAIGHEIDYLISDFVADLRAPTPSAAMEMILPDERELLLLLDDMNSALNTQIQNIFNKASYQIKHIYEVLNAKSPKNQIEIKIQEAKILHEKMTQIFESRLKAAEMEIGFGHNNLDFGIKNLLSQKSSRLSLLNNRLSALNPKDFSNESFPLLVKDGKKTSLKNLSKGDIVELQSASLVVAATIQKITELVD